MTLGLPGASPIAEIVPYGYDELPPPPWPRSPVIVGEGVAAVGRPVELVAAAVDHRRVAGLELHRHEEREPVGSNGRPNWLPPLKPVQLPYW